MAHNRRAFLVAAGAAVVAGCSGGRTQQLTTTETASESTSTTETTTKTTAGPERSSVDLLLNWKPSGLHVPYYAAKAEGFYREAGFDEVTVESGKGSDFSAKQVGLGNSAFGVTSADQVLNVNTRGLSPRAVAVVMQKSPVVVFAAREQFGGKLTDAEQLAGKTVGTGPGMVRLMTKLLLERKGVLEDVELVDTGYSTVQKLLDGEIDAAGGVFGDAISAQNQGYTTDSIRVADTIPSYGHVLVADDAFASANPRTVEAFLRATAHGAAWAHQHPEKAVGHLVDANEALAETREAQREKWTTMAEGFSLSEAVRERGWGYSDAEPWRVTYDVLRQADLLGGTLDPKTVWTNDYLDADARYVGDYYQTVTG